MAPKQKTTPKHVVVAGLNVPVCFVRHRRARHYILRLTEEGAARVTVPRFGSQREAMAFVRQHSQWLEQALAELNESRAGHDRLDRVLFRGRVVPVTQDPDLFGSALRFAGEGVPLAGPQDDNRELLAKHLWKLARAELPSMVLSRAEMEGCVVRRVTVRNQKTRWGSCSATKTISLNWRLMHAPEWVVDYVLWHEIMHLKEMNHSARFWKLVARAAPRYKEAEAWLKAHTALLYDVGWTPPVAALENKEDGCLR